MQPTLHRSMQLEAVYSLVDKFELYVLVEDILMLEAQVAVSEVETFEELLAGTSVT